jgi:hypothetical protein
MSDEEQETETEEPVDIEPAPLSAIVGVLTLAAIAVLGVVVD